MTIEGQEVTSIEFVELRERQPGSGQRRQYNYIFKVSTADATTGEPILGGEYRTYATDAAIDVDRATELMTELLENFRGL